MTHQIIRTMDELKALDPDSVVLDRYGDTDPVSGWLSISGTVAMGNYLPAVVIATGDQVRAARKALEEAS